jgi:hypothetical protein
VTYTLMANSWSVTRDADNASIPGDPRNADWQAYQEWLEAGGVPTAYIAPPTEPTTLTFLQFMALFTPAEQASIVSSDDPQVKLFTLMAAGAGGILLSDSEVIAGVNYLVTNSILTAPRATAVLAGQAS